MWRDPDPVVSPPQRPPVSVGGAVIVYADGGSRGNPGPAGYGAVVLDPAGAILAERCGPLGVTTNNVAEYSGLIAALEAARDLRASVVTARLDSRLVVEQMSGRWKIKNAELQRLAAAATALVEQFQRVEFEWVPRARNARADLLANRAMDDAAAAPAGSGTGMRGPADSAAAAPAEMVDGATRVVLVRHGQTTWGAELRFAGRQDVPLTALGRSQATAVGKRIGTLAPTHILTSPLQRCTSTAAVIADEVRATVTVDERLVDGLLGDWTGFRVDQIAERWPREFAAWRSDPDAAPPGGESFTGIRDRVWPVVDDAVESRRGTTLVLVTHAAPAKMILAAALGADSGIAYRVRIDTASLSGFTVQPSGAVMVWAVNETGHLVG